MSKKLFARLFNLIFCFLAIIGMGYELFITQVTKELLIKAYFIGLLIFGMPILLVFIFLYFLTNNIQDTKRSIIAVLITLVASPILGFGLWAFMSISSWLMWFTVIIFVTAIGGYLYLDFKEFSNQPTYDLMSQYVENAK